MLAKQWVMIGSISAFLGVVLGAFGAHALKDSLSIKSLAIYNTAVQYQMIHSLALIGLGVWAAQNPALETQLCGYAFVFGIAIFSGSLYALAMTDMRLLGAVTPIGGVLFLIGWIRFAFLAWKA